MKKMLIMLLFATVCGNVKAQWDWGYYAATSFAGGLGTARNPYMISTPEQLAFFAKEVNRGINYSGRYIRLETDLDLGAHHWISIGTYSNRFYGTFDGNGKTIKNMMVPIAYYMYNDCRGLFGAVQDAVISNLNIIDCDVQGDNEVGGIAGYAGGSITNCSVTGTVSGYGNYIGGIAGFTYATITNCRSEANVIGGDYVGGLAGFLANNITGCSATGSVKGLLSNVGGLAGYLEWSEMTDCFATGSVTGFRNVGGLIGETNESCTITGCFAVGTVTGYVPLFGSSEDIGGLIGVHGLDCIVTECFASGSVSGGINVGGLAGRSSSISIENCYAVGTVTGNTSVGGLTGEDGAEEVINCYTAGAVVGTTNWGGFTGTGADYYASCFFDYQATGTYRGIGNKDSEPIEPVTTPSFTNGDLPHDFANSGKWQAVEGYYPQLICFANHSNSLIRQWSALSVTPLFLANTEELCSDVKTPFSLVEKSASGAGISWSISPDVYNSADNYRVTCNNPGEWNRLTLSSGACSRTIAFRSEKGFGDADLLAFVVNGKKYLPQNPTKIILDCSLTSPEIPVQLEMSTFASASTGSVITVKTDRSAVYTYEITINSVDGSKSQKYTLEVENPFPSSIFVQRWPDVLAINNNFATNGGYNFIGYEWYKNSVKLPDETKGYIQISPATYTAMLTTQQGHEISVCPIVISSVSAPKMAVWPNPARSGQAVYVEIGMEPAGAVMQLFSPTGNLVAKQTLHDPVTEIIAPDTPGTYILQITVNGKAQAIKIAVE